jgi:hypothetical protein
MRSPLRTVVLGSAILPLIVVTPDSSAYLYKSTLSSAQATTKRGAFKGKPHIVLNRAVSKFGRDDFKYFSVEPATFCHGRVWVPIRCDLAQARMTRWCGCRCWCWDGIGGHGGENHATENVSKLIRWWYKDKWEMDFVCMKRKDG